MKKRLSKMLLSLLILITLNSCIGLSMDIQMLKNGSGRINLEYRISQMLESIGKLDGNENFPIVPVGRADWERSISRIPGISLVSFSSSQRLSDLIVNVTLEYTDVQALLNFLDPAEERMSYSPGKININLFQPGLEISSDLLEFAQMVSVGYKFSFSFSAEGNSVLAITDGTGKEIPTPLSTEVTQSGKKVSMSMDIMDIFTQQEGLGVSVSWQ